MIVQLRPRFHRLLLVFFILAGFALRLLLLTNFSLREDEAIYGFWALHFIHDDPWFLHVWPDKPPLFIWLLSVAFSVWGEVPASGRLLNIFLSALTIPLVGALAHRLWGERAALFATLAMALNPFAISFAPTLFTDPLLVFAGTMALYLALSSARFGAGFWLGAAIMTKQQGLLYLPLVLGSVWSDQFQVEKKNLTQSRKERQVFFHLRFVLGLLLVLLPVLLWDSQRWAIAPSPWDWSLHNYAPLTIAPITDWPQHFQAWGELFWYLTASWPVWSILLIGCLVWLLNNQPYRLPLKDRLVIPVGIFMRICTTILKIPNGNDRLSHAGSRRTFSTALNPTLSRSHPSPPATRLLPLWSIAFITLHLVTTIQPWDRYLLPLAPVVALLFGWLVRVGSRESEVSGQKSVVSSPHSALRILHSTFLALTTILLFFPAWQAALGQFPIGGDHGAYNGLETIISDLRSTAEIPERQVTSQAPTSGNPHSAIHGVEPSNRQSLILYHRTLGWHYQFYLYDPVRSDQVELRWYPSSVYLADNASKAPHLRKFLIEPDWSPARDLRFALQQRGLSLRQIQQRGHFTLFEIVQPSQGYCTWCRSDLRRQPFPTLTTASDPAMICK